MISWAYEELLTDKLFEVYLKTINPFGNINQFTFNYHADVRNVSSLQNFCFDHGL